MIFKKLSRLLPDFLRKPGTPKPKPAPALTVAAPPTQAPAALESESAKPTKPQQLLDDICAFLARYLQCGSHQRTVLALWILHTHSFAAARSTPYLAIQSTRRLAGKTLCLRLLSLLCSHPALTSGYTPATLVKRIHSHATELPTFLLDESPATLGSRSRSRNPRLRAILVSGFQPGIGYSDGSLECTVFSPKAFASLGPLPEPLADCSLPILLHPLRDPEQSHIQRFDLETARQQAQPLLAALENWARKNISALKSAPAFNYKDFPQRLTWRGQDLVEPLLHLADLVGGDYPARARQALLQLFDDPARQQRAIELQLLRDLRACFEHHRWPHGLPTSLILSDLHSLPARPWDIDGPITDRSLAKILRPYNIRPRVLKKSSGSTGSSARGYLQEEFVSVWHNLLDNSENRGAQPSSTTNVSNSSGAQPPSAAKASSQQPLSSNKDASSYAATDARTSSLSANPSQSAAKDPAAAALSSQKPIAQSQRPAGVSQEPVSSNKDAAGYAATPAADALPPGVYRHSWLESRIKGILDNPLNFYRQYPAHMYTSGLSLGVNEYHYWPQPADDKMPPDMVFKFPDTPDGTPIPFTRVNRPPDERMANHPDNYTQRWPVQLDQKERLQVAVARYYELFIAANAEKEKKQREAAAAREQPCSAVS